MASASTAKSATKTPIEETPPTSGATSTPHHDGTGSVISRARAATPNSRCRLQDQEAQQDHDCGNRGNANVVGLLTRSVAEHLSVVLVREGDTAQSRVTSCGHIRSAASIDHGGHVEASGNAVVVDRDRIGSDAHLRDLAEPDLLPDGVSMRNA